MEKRQKLWIVYFIASNNLNNYSIKIWKLKH